MPASSSRLVLLAHPAYSQALSELPTVDVSFDLDDVHMSIRVERNDVRAEPIPQRRLAGNGKELDTDERIEVRPEQVLDLLLVELGTCLHPSEGNEFVVANHK